MHALLLRTSHAKHIFEGTRGVLYPGIIGARSRLHRCEFSQAKSALCDPPTPAAALRVT